MDKRNGRVDPSNGDGHRNGTDSSDIDDLELAEAVDGSHLVVSVDISDDSDVIAVDDEEEAEEEDEDGDEADDEAEDDEDEDESPGEEGAAAVSRLPYDQLSPNEEELFPEVAKGSEMQRRNFLHVRNQLVSTRNLCFYRKVHI